MLRLTNHALLVLILLLLASMPLAMQIATGTIEGKITDEFGPVPKIAVEARNMITGTVYRDQSNATGDYRIVSVHPGWYALWVIDRNKDSMWIREINVDQGRTVREDVHLVRAHPTTNTW